MVVTKCDPDPAPAMPNAASQIAFDLVESRLSEAFVRHQLVGNGVAARAAYPARHLYACAGLQIRKMEIAFPAHQKSSASGMRV